MRQPQSRILIAAPVFSVLDNVIRRNHMRLVKHVSCKGSVALSELVIDADRKVIFAGGGCRGTYEKAQPSADVAAVGQRIEIGIRVDSRADFDIPGWQNPRPRVGRRNAESGRAGEPLAEPFVLSEEESSVFHDRPAQAAAKLVAFERGNPRQVEEVARVQSGIPYELECGPMNLICPGSGYQAYDSAGGAAKFRSVAARKNLIFANRFDSGKAAGKRAGCGTGKVVN